MNIIKNLLIFSSILSNSHSFNIRYKVPPVVAKSVVKKATAFLPAVDTIGHNVLNLNREIIDYVIDINYLTPEIKKGIILSLIELAQGGDMMGSLFIDIYYNLVYILL